MVTRPRMSRHNICILSAVLVIASGVALPWRSLSGSVKLQTAQTSTHKSGKTKSGRPAPSALKEASVPFRMGESLKYQVSWAAFATAADVELSIPERRELYGWKTWHFRATAHTVSPVRTLFTIDDQFDSY